MVSTRESFSRRISARSNDLFLLTQLSMIAGVAIVLATVSQSGDTAILAVIVDVSGVLVAYSIAAFLLPPAAFPRAMMLVVGVLDLAIVAVLRVELIAQQPRVSILVLIPVLWLCYLSGIAGLLVSIAADYLIALTPFLLHGGWPSTPSDWGRESLFPAIIGLVSIAVFLGAARLQRQNGRLLVSDGKLQVSLEHLLDADASALAVFQSVDTGILFYAPDGRILLANDAAQKLRLIGGGESKTIMTPTPLVFAEDRVTPVSDFDQTENRAARGELTLRRTSWVGTGAEQRAIIVTSRYVRRASGELIGTVIAMHDVTSLADALRIKGEFLATISHELRTPLTSIIGYLEIIEESPELEAIGIAAEVAVVHRNSERLLQLISALLGQVNSPRELSAQRIELSGLIGGCVASTRRAALIAEVLVESQFLEPVSAVVDGEQLRVVIENVLSNAIKFTPAGGHVSLSLARDGADAVVRIADDGLGIPAAERSRIFDPFFRGVVARNRVSAGAGLGLSTAKSIITAHGGTIQAHNIDSGGTTIEIRVPIGD
jgi:two-component system, OmpR family, phosphate regulon sensor histidine kinase PhoR